MSAPSPMSTRRSKSYQLFLSTFFVGSWMHPMRLASMPDDAALIRYPPGSSRS